MAPSSHRPRPWRVLFTGFSSDPNPGHHYATIMIRNIVSQPPGQSSFPSWVRNTLALSTSACDTYCLCIYLSSRSSVRPNITSRPSSTPYSTVRTVISVAPRSNSTRTWHRAPACSLMQTRGMAASQSHRQRALSSSPYHPKRSRSLNAVSAADSHFTSSLPVSPIA
jgi:hypothetical protein